MKTRAAVLYESGQPAPYADSKPLKIETLQLDSPRANEVMIKIKATGLCHSDLSVITGSTKRPTPLAIGHEAAGEIVEIGEGVHNYEIGDHVVCTFVPSCGECLPCREGRPALCEPGATADLKGEMLDGGHRLHTEDGKPIHHHLGVSGFSEYATVSKNSIVKVDPKVPFENLAIFGCSIITGVGEVVNTANIKPGSTVAVVGLGGIGLSAVIGAKLAGAAEIIALDINPDKFKLAKELGATSTYDSSDPDIIEKLKDVHSGGLDYAFETAGAIPSMEVAYNITKRGGTTVTSGLPNIEQKFSFPQFSLTADEKTIKGSYLGSCVPVRDIPQFIKLYNQGRLPVDQLLTGTISLDEINEGFDQLAEGKVNRLLVKMS